MPGSNIDAEPRVIINVFADLMGRAVWFLDNHLHLKWVSDNTDSLLGMQPCSLLGLKYENLLAPGLRQRFVHNIREGQREHYEETFTLDGEEYIFRSIPFPSDAERQINGVVVIISHVNPIKKETKDSLERILTSLNAEDKHG